MGFLNLFEGIYWRLPYKLRRLIYKLLRPHEYNRYQELINTKPQSPRAYSLYSYIENKCIFVHIPKCAGVSISHALFGHLGGGHLSITAYQRIFNQKEFN